MLRFVIMFFVPGSILINFIFQTFFKLMRESSQQYLAVANGRLAGVTIVSSLMGRPAFMRLDSDFE